MLEKIDLHKIILEDEEESINSNSRKIKKELLKELTIEGYDTLCDLYNDLVDYIEKHRDLLLSSCVGLKNAQQEIKNEYNTLLDYNQKNFDHLLRLLADRQKRINKKENKNEY